MINFFRRRTRIAVNRAIKKKNPFIIGALKMRDLCAKAQEMNAVSAGPDLLLFSSPLFSLPA